MIVSLRPWMVNMAWKIHRKSSQCELTQFLMERMDPATIVWLRSLPLLEKKEVEGLRFSLSHNLPDKNYGGDLLVGNDTEKFDQLLDEGNGRGSLWSCSQAVASLWQSRATNHQSRFDWHALF